MNVEKNTVELKLLDFVFDRKLYDQYKSGETTLNNSRIEIEAQQNIMHRSQPPLPKSAYSPAHTIRKTSAISAGKDGGANGKLKNFRTFSRVRALADLE